MLNVFGDDSRSDADLKAKIAAMELVAEQVGLLGVVRRIKVAAA